MANKNIELGREAEAAFILAATRAGWRVAIPVHEGLAYDFLCDGPSDWGVPRLLRVQVKAATSGPDGEWHLLCRQKVAGKYHHYEAQRIDLLAAWTGQDWWLIGAESLPKVTHVVLRDPSSVVKYRQKKNRMHPQLDVCRNDWQLRQYCSAPTLNKSAEG